MKLKLRSKPPINLIDAFIKILKFTTLSVFMILGQMCIYVIVLNLVGLPMTDLAMWITFGLSIIGEFVYLEWISY
jgi:hypothetical protein